MADHRLRWQRTWQGDSGRNSERDSKGMSGWRRRIYAPWPDSHAKTAQVGVATPNSKAGALNQIRR
jgi:hypothetical protein